MRRRRSRSGRARNRTAYYIQSTTARILNVCRNVMACVHGRIHHHGVRKARGHGVGNILKWDGIDLELIMILE